MTYIFEIQYFSWKSLGGKFITCNDLPFLWNTWSPDFSLMCASSQKQFLWALNGVQCIHPVNERGASLVSVKHTITPPLFAKAFCREIIYTKSFCFQRVQHKVMSTRNGPILSQYSMSTNRKGPHPLLNYLICNIIIGDSCNCFRLCQWTKNLDQA